jgi:hypothetical protein
MAGRTTRPTGLRCGLILTTSAPGVAPGPQLRPADIHRDTTRAPELSIRSTQVLDHPPQVAASSWAQLIRIQSIPAATRS